VLDGALEEFRAAPDREARHAAELRIAERMAQLRVATVLFAPAPVLLASRRLEGIEWLDDLPRLDALWLRPVAEEGEWELP
jgi:hypothetical protein